jgi:hypothetical protein
MSFPAQEATNCCSCKLVAVPLHCSWVFQLKKQQIAASCKLVAMPQLTVGPTSRNLLLEHYQMGELLWLLQTQKQPNTLLI